jgi:hypothetical protein
VREWEAYESLLGVGVRIGGVVVVVVFVARALPPGLEVVEAVEEADDLHRRRHAHPAHPLGVVAAQEERERDELLAVQRQVRLDVAHRVHLDLPALAEHLRPPKRDRTRTTAHNAHAHRVGCQ